MAAMINAVRQICNVKLVKLVRLFHFLPITTLEKHREAPQLQNLPSVRTYHKYSINIKCQKWEGPPNMDFEQTGNMDDYAPRNKGIEQRKDLYDLAIEEAKKKQEKRFNDRNCK